MFKREGRIPRRQAPRAHASAARECRPGYTWNCGHTWFSRGRAEGAYLKASISAACPNGNRVLSQEEASESAANPSGRQGRFQRG